MVRLVITTASPEWLSARTSASSLSAPSRILRKKSERTCTEAQTAHGQQEGGENLNRKGDRDPCEGHGPDRAEKRERNHDHGYHHAGYAAEENEEQCGDRPHREQHEDQHVALHARHQRGIQRRPSGSIELEVGAAVALEHLLQST